MARTFIQRSVFVTSIVLVACGGASAPPNATPGATASGTNDPNACECLAWKTVDFSFQDLATGEWCRGGRECAEKYDLRTNECADPGGYEKKPWCYVSEGCENKHVSMMQGLFWKSCDG